MSLQKTGEIFPEGNSFPRGYSKLLHVFPKNVEKCVD